MTTQPQDKMRADIPTEMLQELFDAAVDAGNLLFLPWRDLNEMRNETAERINAAIAAIRSLPCTQQSEASATLSQIAEVAACFGADWPDVDGEPEVLRRVKWAARQLKDKSEQPMQDATADGRWLVFNIGCIECGVSSNVVGRFGTENEAKAIAATCDESLGWREGGQNSFEVFDLNAPQASEYTAAIATQGASDV